MRHTLAELNAMPTLHDANGAELKVDGPERHWLEPVGAELPYRRTVTVEHQVIDPDTEQERWGVVERYDAENPADTTPGPYAAAQRAR